MKRITIFFAVAVAAVSACFGASSSAAVRVAYAPGQAKVTNASVVALPTQWTVTTAVTATTSFFTATPTTATVTTTSTITTGASASPSGFSAADFDGVE